MVGWRWLGRFWLRSGGQGRLETAFFDTPEFFLKHAVALADGATFSAHHFLHFGVEVDVLHAFLVGADAHGFGGGVDVLGAGADDSEGFLVFGDHPGDVSDGADFFHGITKGLDTIRGVDEPAESATGESEEEEKRPDHLAAAAALEALVLFFKEDAKFFGRDGVEAGICHGLD